FKRTNPNATDQEVRAARKRWLDDNPPPPATIAQLADHIDHLAEVMGPEHVGIGSDFDGGELLPLGLADVSMFPNLFAELFARGYTDDELAGIAGGNVLRVMRGAEAAARRIQAERPPSEATIEALDG
ncbi:MAG TPA: membrane dipeptidase, partial [Candidatus Limnocylindrales bacterium]